MEKIWWERVPNAISFTSDIVRTLLEEKSLLLQHAEVIPWHGEMVRQIREEVRQQNSSKGFDEVRGVDDPGPYLLKEYCKREKRADYRPPMTLASFFAQSEDIVLHKKYLWVTLSSAESLASWVDFVAEYWKGRKKHPDAAVFVLDYAGKASVSRKKGITCFRFEDYITEYDRIVFATLASSGVREDSFIKEYLTELAANVLGNDIELCAACLDRYETFLSDPYGTIEQIVREERRSGGDLYSFHLEEELVHRGIWRAQIRTVYPRIEEFREDFVQRHAADIKRALPMASPTGELYETPEEVELGPLLYLSGSGQLPLTKAEHDELKRYRDARNTLSHLEVLTLQEIRGL